MWPKLWQRPSKAAKWKPIEIVTYTLMPAGGWEAPQPVAQPPRPADPGFPSSSAGRDYCMVGFSLDSGIDLPPLAISSQQTSAVQRRSGNYTAHGFIANPQGPTGGTPGKHDEHNPKGAATTNTIVSTRARVPTPIYRTPQLEPSEAREWEKQKTRDTPIRLRHGSRERQGGLVPTGPGKMLTGSQRKAVKGRATTNNFSGY